MGARGSRLSLFTFLTVILCLNIRAADDKIFLDDNGLVVVEMEDVPLVGSWTLETNNPCEDKGRPVYGDGWLQAGPGNDYGCNNNDIMTYPIKVSRAGTYSFKFRVHKSKHAECGAFDACNDACVYWEENDLDYSHPSKTLGKASCWAYKGNREHDGSIVVDLEANRVYHLNIQRRSQYFAIDRFVLYTSDRSSDATADGNDAPCRTPVEINGEVVDPPCGVGTTANAGVRRPARTIGSLSSEPPRYYSVTGARVEKPAQVSSPTLLIGVSETGVRRIANFR